MSLEPDQTAWRKPRGDPGKHVQGRGNGHCKGPRTEAGLTRGRMCKEASVARREVGRGKW